MIGDTVNLASRLEKMTKHYGAPIIISDATRHWLYDKFPTQFIGNLMIRGKRHKVKAYAVLTDRAQLLSDKTKAMLKPEEKRNDISYTS